MKKKMIIIMSAGVLMAASLTGCGTKAEATDNIIVGEENLDSEETIVVSDAENLMKAISIRLKRLLQFIVP